MGCGLACLGHDAWPLDLASLSLFVDLGGLGLLVFSLVLFAWFPFEHFLFVFLWILFSFPFSFLFEHSGNIVGDGHLSFPVFSTFTSYWWPYIAIWWKRATFPFVVVPEIAPC